jgi:hypothetical protein
MWFNVFMSKIALCPSRYRNIWTEKAAPLLDITVSEFMRRRKNESKSGLLQFGQQTFAVTVPAKFLIIHAAIFFPHILFQRSQQVVRGVIQNFGFGLSPAFRCRFHAPKLAQTVRPFNSKVQPAESRCSGCLLARLKPDGV